MSGASITHTMTQSDLDVIYLRPTPEEKAVIAAAAARVRRSVNAYVLNAALDRARQDLAGLVDTILPKTLPRTCIHCGRLLSRGNESNFCRVCQRTVGLATLRKLHSQEVVSHGQPDSSPPRGRKRRH